MCLLCASEIPARAQPSTADGVAAFKAGDYKRAAEILRPIAERSSFPRDQDAAFYMAQLYDTGRGVAPDPLRACALYLRVSEPASQQTLEFEALGRVIAANGLHDRDWQETCERLSMSGMDIRFDSVSFSLEPGQWVDVDFNGATVNYQGQSKHFTFPFLFFPGSVVLPVIHTELTTRSGRRHFIEVAFWETAVGGRPTRGLSWFLFEVIGDDFHLCDATEIAKVASTEPLSALDVDVQQYVRLRVNKAGRPEWLDTDGETHVIESASERETERLAGEKQKALDLARARAAAAADPARLADVQRTPSPAFGDAQACDGHNGGNLYLVYVVGWSADYADQITVSAERSGVWPLHSATTFDIAQSPDIKVNISVRKGAGRGNACSDTFTPDLPDDVRTWRAVGGVATISVFPREDVHGTRHDVTITIANAEFINDNGMRFRTPKPILLTAEFLDRAHGDR